MFTDPKRSIAQLGIMPGMFVADFGAGAGYVAVEVAEQVKKEGKVYVIDIQKELLTKATHLAQEHHLSSLVFIYGDLEQPQGSTLPDGAVDLVIISNMLFQVEDKKAVLCEAHRILREQGRLFVVDWRESFGGMGPQPEYVLHEHDALELVRACSFEVVSTIEVGAYHYGFTAKKHGNKK